MALKELYHPESGRMRVAGFMSGSGTNLRRIIEHEWKIEAEEGRVPYRVSVIFSDNPASNAMAIGKEFGIPVFVSNIVDFYKRRGKPMKDMATRAEYEHDCMKLLGKFGCDVAAYAGYMRKATSVFVNSFLGVNVHPADLTVKADNGEPKYRGDHAVRDAILAGEKEIRATTHLVSGEVDCGQILMISAPIQVSLPEGFDPNNGERANFVASAHQNRLKEVGDWEIFPRTLEFIANGRYSQDDQGNLYFDGQPIPNGVRL